MPLAPGRLSMMNGRPSDSPSFWPIMRAAMSMLPPADCETMKRTGRAGQDCAFGFAATSKIKTQSARRIGVDTWTRYYMAHEAPGDHRRRHADADGALLPGRFGRRNALRRRPDR